MDINLLVVVYDENATSHNLILESLSTISKRVKLIAISNRSFGKYPVKIIKNDENCLSKAWNIGLKKIFEVDDVAFVSGLDSVCPTLLQMRTMKKLLIDHPEYGLVSATPKGMFPIDRSYANVAHGDGSFSFFAISKQAFLDVGDFDENFKPAYFEDNDYLERLWIKGYSPKQVRHIPYIHVFQGTIKTSEEANRSYPKFMQDNLEYFRKKWGKTPDHLPSDIRFN